ncbi:MAG: nucleotide exchange factor GrpE [Oscillospiraceae bacterium]
MEPANSLHRAERLIREQVLDGEETPEKVALSLPMVIELSNGAVADAFFVYEEEPGCGRPFAWAKVDSAKEQLLFYARCQVCDFAGEHLPPLGEPLHLTLSQPLTQEERAANMGELWERYEILRSFAFTPSPTLEQQKVMEDCAALLEQLAWQEHRPFYGALAAPFLDWLGLDWGQRPQREKNDASMENLATAVRELSHLFVRKIETDRHKEKLFDQMHQELQQYKNDLLDCLTRSMEGDIIKLIDDVEKTMEHYRSRPFTDENYQRLLSLFEGVGTDLTDLLYRHGLEPYTQEGNEVVVGRQKILATLPTQDKSQDKKVAVRHTKGWEKNGKVIRPERISVYLYTPEEKDAAGEG